MDDDAFWNLVALIDVHKGDTEGAVEALVQAVASLPEDEIISFDDALGRKLYELDTEELGKRFRDVWSYFSPDGFLYTRAWIVGQGRDKYFEVLRDPAAMPTSQEAELEHLTYVARWAYKRKTGREYDHLAEPSGEPFSNRAGWPSLAHIDHHPAVGWEWKDAFRGEA